MKKMNWTRLLALALALSLPLAGLAQTTQPEVAPAVEAAALSVEEMLTRAIQNEYRAQATYEAALAAFGEQEPSLSLSGAEQRHIAAISRLFQAYGLPLPENKAAESVQLPETVEELPEALVQAEETSIALYTELLEQENLPAPLRRVFTNMLRASRQHLLAAQGDYVPGEGGARMGPRGGRMPGRHNARPHGRGQGWQLWQQAPDTTTSPTAQPSGDPT